MNYSKCIKCSFQDKIDKECIACKGSNRIFGPCFKCPICEGYGKFCKICGEKGYLISKFRKCPNCMGEPSSNYRCPVCEGKLIVPDTEKTFLAIELSPKSRPSKQKVIQFIFFKNCRHFSDVRLTTLKNACKCCLNFDTNAKGMYCTTCDLSFCSKCLEKVNLETMLDYHGHKLICSNKNIIRCDKCCLLIEECVSFDCAECKTSICGKCLSLQKKPRFLSISNLMLG